MSRIRTIKPEFFRHEALYELELDTGMPMRIAFAGLWTVCDREGRFKWRPRSIKLDVLPYDDIDFSRVLDALTTRGFIVKYTSHDGSEFGYVPSFNKHQVINNRELKSSLPDPSDCEQLQQVTTRVPHACPTRQDLDQGEGEGEGEGERKGKEDSSNELSLVPSVPDENGSRKKYPDEFESFWKAYPKRPTDTKALAFKAWTKARKSIDEFTLRAAAEVYAKFCGANGHEPMLVQTWVNREGWTASYARDGPKTPAGSRQRPGKVDEIMQARMERERRRNGAI